MSLAPFHTQLLFVQPVVRPPPRGSHDFSQGTHSTHNRSGVFKPNSEARGETYQITSASSSSASAVGKFAHQPALSCGTLQGRNGLGISPSYANHPCILIFYQYQISHSKLLPGSCRGNSSVRHHKVRSRDSEHNTNRLTAPSSRASFLNLSRWLADARALGSPNLVVVLVGNKSDREDEREVEWAEASKWAAENGAFH